MGILISFSGIDGAGKSTQVKLLSKHLKSRGKKVFVTEEMFTYFLLKPLVKLLRKSTGSPGGGPVKKNKKALPKLWFVLAFVDIWIGYLFKFRPMLKKYDYVIADRFYYDIWANLLFYGYLPAWAFVPFLNLLPKPDVPLMLSVDQKSVLKREDDFPVNYYKQQLAIYNRLPKDIHFMPINAKRKPDKVFENIKRILS